jgi:uncharacterized protein YyaL (SSP411 family)
MPTNRLAREKSPYLLQHAHNPVDWFAWGEEAFAKARAEDKPIFLSIGYSTCHWCHVMERESFENERIAGILNRWFVPVKVDREERLDVDRVYMTFVQAATGAGGWPLSVWLTPQLEPFFGGTYFPPENRAGRAGFGAVLEQLSTAWRENRSQIAEWARKTVAELEEATRVAAARPSSRARWCTTSCCATRRARGTARRSTWCCLPCARWRAAESTTSLAADSTATRWTSAGACRISRRCSTTRRSLPCPTWRPTR